VRVDDRLRLGVLTAAGAATAPRNWNVFYHRFMGLLVDDSSRVRTLTLDRPEALNAFDEALYDATTEALLAAADDPTVAVVLLTGNGRAFSAGTDLLEMHRMATDATFERGRHGFVGLVDALSSFPKPLICAVNGIGLGIGATVLGFADLAFMASTARLKCPFTSLGVAPEAASSYLLPRLVGRQNAAWVLLSAEWIGAAEAVEMGLVWKVCEPDELMATARRYAETLAARPISSLRAVKQTMTAPLRDGVAAARERENACFAELMGGPANLEALAAFAEGREPDFSALPAGW
jgi:enoyl-CoA hydratase/carnithine racemase